jgi:hypothetical protein
MTGTTVGAAAGSSTLLLLLLLLVCLLVLGATQLLLLLLAWLLQLPRTCAHFCSIAASVAALIGQKYMRCSTVLLLLPWRLESCGSSGCCSSCMAGPVRLMRRKSVAEDSSNNRQLENSLQAQCESPTHRMVECSANATAEAARKAQRAALLLA